VKLGKNESQKELRKVDIFGHSPRGNKPRIKKSRLGEKGGVLRVLDRQERKIRIPISGRLDPPKQGLETAGDHCDESIRLPKQNVLRKPHLEAAECRKMVPLWSPFRTHENTKQNFPRFLLQNLEEVPVAAGWPDSPSFLKNSLLH
jgi:hypothetical protein